MEPNYVRGLSSSTSIRTSMLGLILAVELIVAEREDACMLCGISDAWGTWFGKHSETECHRGSFNNPKVVHIQEDAYMCS